MQLRFRSLALREVPWLWWSVIGAVLAAAAAIAAHAALRPVQLTGGVGFMPSLTPRTPGAAAIVPRPVVVVLAVEILLACVVTGTIAWRASRTGTARVLAGFLGAVTFVWAYMWFVIPLGTSTPLPLKMQMWLLLTGLVAAGAAFVHFTSQFPRALTPADVMRGQPPGRFRRAVGRLLDRLRRVVALLGFERTERTTRVGAQPVDAVLLAGALVALVLTWVSIDKFSHDAATAARIQATLSAAARVASLATWVALIAVAGGPLLRLETRAWLGSTVIPARLHVLAIAIAVFAVLPVIGNVRWMEAMALATAAILVARMGPAMPDARGRRLDWWLALSLIAAAVIAPKYIPLNGPERVIAFAVFLVAVIGICLVWAIGRLGQHALDAVARSIHSTFRESLFELRAGDVATSAPQQPETGQIIRCLLLRPRFVWGMVFATGAGLVAWIGLISLVGSARVVSVSWTSGALYLLALVLAAAVPLTLTVGLMVRGAAQLRLGYALSDGSARKRALWLVVGLNTAVGLFIIGHVVPLVVVGLSPGVSDGLTSVAFLAPFPITVASVAAAVFYHGALDPRLTLRATSLYTLLGVIGVVAYAGVENLIEEGVTVWLGLPPSSGPWLAGGAVALTVGAIRGRLSAVVAGAVARAFPEVVLEDGDEVTAVVASIDIADDHAAAPSEVRLTMRRAALLQSAARAAHQHGGRVATATRDLVVFEFRDAAGALEGVAAVTAEYERRCARGRVPLVPLRSGVHMGHVLRASGGTLFGPVIDVADDLRRRAPAGSILVTDVVLHGAGAVGVATPWGDVDVPGGGGVVSAFQVGPEALELSHD